MEEKDAYGVLIEEKLTRKKAFNTYNRDILHATELVIAGFRHAKREICLLSQELDTELYGVDRLQAAVESFLRKKNASLRVLVEVDIEQQHPMMMLRERFPNKIWIGQVKKELLEVYTFNFMTVDDFGYRFEHDRKEFVAIASFHEEDQKIFLANLKKFFKLLEESATPVKKA